MKHPDRVLNRKFPEAQGTQALYPYSKTISIIDNLAIVEFIDSHKAVASKFYL